MLSKANRRLLLGTSGWWHPATAIELDVLTGRYMRAGRPAALTDAVLTSRASAALMADAAGAYVSFGANQPTAIAGVGLDIFGQYDNFLLSPEDFTSGDWSNTHITTANAIAGPDGNLTADLLVHDGTTNGNVLQQIPGGFTAGARNSSVLHVKNYNSTRSHFQLRSPPNTLTDADIYWDGATVTGYNINQGGGVTFKPVALADGWYRLEALVTLPVANTNNKFFFEADAERSGKGVYAVGAGLYELDFVPPYEPSQRFATTITDPDFGHAVAAYGLDAGFKLIANIALDRLADADARCVWAAGVDADNHARLDITPADTALFTLRKAGADVLTLESGAFAATGDKDIAVVARDGAWALTATGVAGDNDPGTYGLPALSAFRYASRFGDAAYLNGRLNNLAIGRAA